MGSCAILRSCCMPAYICLVARDETLPAEDCGGAETDVDDGVTENMGAWWSK